MLWRWDRGWENEWGWEEDGGPPGVVRLVSRDVGGNPHNTGRGQAGLQGGLVNEWGMDGWGRGGRLFLLSPCWLGGVGELDLRQFFLVDYFFLSFFFFTL